MLRTITEKTTNGDVQQMLKKVKGRNGLQGGIVGDRFEEVLDGAQVILT
jgi:hypothetical protein